MSLEPWKHETMTVITYSRGGHLLKEFQVLECPSASWNVAELLSKFAEPWTMLDPLISLTLQFFEVKGQRWMEKDAKGEKGKRMSGTRRKWMKRTTICFRNTNQNNVIKDPESGRECLERRLGNRVDDSGTLSAAETEGVINGKEEGRWKWCSVFLPSFYQKTTSEGYIMKHPLFLWLILVLITLCPKTASSQVRATHKTEA